MWILVELPSFTKQAKAVWNESEHGAFAYWLSQAPEAGEAIPGARGARKARWGGAGKSGGEWTVYYYPLPAAEQIALIALYAEPARETGPAREAGELP